MSSKTLFRAVPAEQQPQLQGGMPDLNTESSLSVGIDIGLFDLSQMGSNLIPPTSILPTSLTPVGNPKRDTTPAGQGYSFGNNSSNYFSPNGVADLPSGTEYTYLIVYWMDAIGATNIPVHSDDGGGNRGFQFQISSTGQPIGIGFNTSASNFNATGIARAAKQTEVALMRVSATSVSIFQNGAKTGTTALTGTIAPVVGFRHSVGARSSTPFNGHLVALVRWKRALTDSEASQVTANPWQIWLDRQYITVPASLAHVQQDLVASYAILGSVQQDLTASYVILNAVQKDLTASYTILNAIQKDLVASYAIVGSAYQDLVASYDIIGSVQQDLVASYDIIGSVQQDLVASYGIASAVQKDLDATYVISQGITQDLTASYVIINSVQKDLTADYAISGAVSQDLVATYDIVGTVTKDLVSNYDILNATSVSASFSFSYDILNAVQQDLTAEYGIMSAVSQDLEATYDIYNSVSQDLEATYVILNAVQKDLVAEYGISEAVAADLVAEWTISQGISVDLVAEYQVFSSSGGSGASVEEIVEGVWSKVIEHGLTAEQMLRIVMAPLAGKATGIGTLEETYYGQNGTKPRVTATFDEESNRIEVEVDGSP